MDIARNIDLDPNRVTLAADLYNGYANIQRTHDSVESRLLLASCKVIAASYYSLVNPVTSRKCFREGADAYSRLEVIMEPQSQSDTLGNAATKQALAFGSNRTRFEIPLAICGDDLSLLRDRVSGEPPDYGEPPDQVFFQLLGAIELSVRGEYGVRELATVLIRSWLPDQYLEVGRLRLPFRVYLNAATEFLRLGEQKEPRESLRRAISPILSQLEDVIGAVMRPKRQWEYLQSGVLPIEPEALAVFVIADRLCRFHSDGSFTIGKLVADSPFQRAKVYAYAATELNGQHE